MFLDNDYITWNDLNEYIEPTRDKNLEKDYYVHTYAAHTHTHILKYMNIKKHHKWRNEHQMRNSRKNHTDDR